MQYTEQTATRMEATIGYPFSNQLLCVEATQMASPTAAAIFKNQFRGVPNNKRLAILGDAILQKVLCAAWFESDDGQGRISDPSAWTTLRNDVLSNESLARRAYDFSINDLVQVANGTHHKTPKMVATTLEAIIGAVFQDGGDDAVNRVIKHLGFLDHPILTVMSHTHPYP